MTPEEELEKIRQMMEQKYAAQAAAPEDDGGISFSKIKENFVPSAKQFASDITAIITNPVGTVSSLYDLGEGVLDYAGLDLNDTDKSAVAQAVGQALVDRYGSGEAIINTINTDPVGFFSDAMSLVSGGAGMVAKVPGLSKAATVSKFANLLDPATAGIPAIGTALSKAKVPEALYNKGVKFTNATDADLATKTALEHGIAPTEGGISKAQGLIEDRLTRIDNVIANADPQTFDLTDILSELESMKTESLTPTSAALNKAIDSRIEGLLELAAERGQDVLTGPELLDFRRGGDAKINYNRASVAPEQEQVTSRLTNIARDKLNESYPEIREINKELSGLIETRKGLERRVPVLERANMVNLPMMMALTGGGGAAGGLTGGAAGLVGALATNPTVQSGAGLAGQAMRNYATPIQKGIEATGQASRVGASQERTMDSYIEMLIKLLREEEELNATR